MSEAFNNEAFNNDDELVANLQSLKQHAGWLFIASVIARWKTQNLDEIIKESNFENIKELRAEYKAYGKVLNLPNYLIQDLTESTDKVKLDAYESSN